MAATTDFWPVSPGWRVTLEYELKKADQGPCWVTHEYNVVGWIRTYDDGSETWGIEPAVHDGNWLAPVTSLMPPKTFNYRVTVEDVS